MNRPKTIASLNKRERARYLAACARYQAEGQVDRHEPEQRGTGFFLTWTRRDNAGVQATARSEGRVD